MGLGKPVVPEECKISALQLDSSMECFARHRGGEAVDKPEREASDLRLPSMAP